MWWKNLNLGEIFLNLTIDGYLKQSWILETKIAKSRHLTPVIKIFRHQYLSPIDLTAFRHDFFDFFFEFSWTVYSLYKMIESDFNLVLVLAHFINISSFQSKSPMKSILLCFKFNLIFMVFSSYSLVLFWIEVKYFIWIISGDFWLHVWSDVW